MPTVHVSDVSGLMNGLPMLMPSTVHVAVGRRAGDRAANRVGGAREARRRVRGGRLVQARRAERRGPGAAQHQRRNHRPLRADLRVPRAVDVRIVVPADRRRQLEVLEDGRIQFGEQRVDVARAERRRVAEAHDVARFRAGRARVGQLLLHVLVADGQRQLPALELVEVARRLGVEDRVLGTDAPRAIRREPVVDRRIVQVRVGADPVIAVRAGAARPCCRRS